MKAALVSSFTEPPRLAEVADPEPLAGEALVRVRAAALSQLVRLQASGKHYGSAKPPLVPGADGVGELEGRRVYFAFPRPPHGSMAELSIVSRDYLVDVPDTLDDVTAAALANPGMSSWAGLARAGFQAGQSVLIVGATGASGRLAVQIARHLGASRVIATGRTAERAAPLRELGAHEVIALEQDEESLARALRAEVERGLDVVLDYLWGRPAERVLSAISGFAVDQGAHALRYVQIGSLAGEAVQVGAAVMRSAPLSLMGSGLGSAPKTTLIAAIAGVFKIARAADLRIATEARPLSDVQAAFAKKTDARVVFTT